MMRLSRQLVYLPLKWLILSAIFLMGCERYDMDSSGELINLSLQKRNGLSFPLDSVSTFESVDMGLLQHDTSKFFLYNKFLNRIHIYDLKTQNKVDVIHYTNEPKHNLSDALGMYFWSSDTLVFFHRPLRVSLWDKKTNELIERNLVQLPLLENKWAMQEGYFAGFTRPVRQNDSSILINLAPILRLIQQKEINASLSQFSFLSTLNVFTGALEETEIKYPTSADRVHPGISYQVAFTSSDAYLYVLFFHDGTVYKIEKEKMLLVEERVIKSDFYPVDFTPTKEMENGRDVVIFRESTNRFFQILHDPFRKLLYVQLMHPVKDYKPDTRYFSMAEKPVPFSILILDEELNKLGEVEIPNGEHYFLQGWFVGSQGLYISTNNFNNPDLREDFLDFDLFVLDSLSNM